jgi:hypothetical protein
LSNRRAAARARCTSSGRRLASGQREDARFKISSAPSAARIEPRSPYSIKRASACASRTPASCSARFSAAVSSGTSERSARSAVSAKQSAL